MGILTPDETAKLVAAWDLVKQDYKGHGGKYFAHLFSKHPDARAGYFPSIGDDAAFASLGEKVLGAIGGIVDLLKAGNDGAVVEEIKKLAVNHHKRKEARVPQFKVVIECLIEYLGGALGAAACDDVFKKLLLGPFIDTVGAEMTRLG